MISDLTEIKSILNIEVDSYDQQILNLMKPVQSDILNYCHNWFLVKEIYYQSSDLVFTNVANNPDTITESGIDFEDKGFYSGEHIAVVGSILNDGVYKVATVATGILTLNMEENLLDEDNDEYVTLYRVNFPPAVKMAYARIIGNYINTTLGPDVKSEKIGDYSMTYSGEIPKMVKSTLNKFRLLNFVGSFDG